MSLPPPSLLLPPSHLNSPIHQPFSLPIPFPYPQPPKTLFFLFSHPQPNTPTTASSPLENDITDSSLRRFLLKVIPLQPGDCLGCKLVGTSVMVASGVIVMISARAGRARQVIAKQ